MKLGYVAWLACVAIAPMATAQQQSQAQQALVEKLVTPQFVVKTIDLHHMSSAAAVKLLQPYSRSAGGGVYDVSPSVRAVTIRETPAIVAEMMAVLSRYDRDPANVTLNFQLIAAENVGARDPAVAGLDSLLRGVLKFSGYHLLGTSVANTGENENVTQTIPTERGSYTLDLEVSDLRGGGSDASVHLNVSLFRPPTGPDASTTSGASIARMIEPIRMNPNLRVLRTGVTVPIGQTVILGTTAAGDSASRSALILTVRPQLAPQKK